MNNLEGARPTSHHSRPFRQPSQRLSLLTDRCGFSLSAGPTSDSEEGLTGSAGTTIPTSRPKSACCVQHVRADALTLALAYASEHAAKALACYMLELALALRPAHQGLCRVFWRAGLKLRLVCRSNADLHTSRSFRPDQQAWLTRAKTYHRKGVPILGGF